MTPPLVAHVDTGGHLVGKLALGPGPRGASREDRELVSVVSMELGGPLRVVALVEQTRRLAMSDPLTGLLNRRAFVEHMNRGLAGFERYGNPLSIVMLDIDHFKQVNDTHGHDGGDAVLLAVADILRGFARKTDVVARWGGEEFVVGLSHTSVPAAAIPAERMRRAIMERPFELPGGVEVNVTASLGVATAVAGEGLYALVARADQAMYLAKQRGRNRCEWQETPGSP
jgi:two-component system cell cycle response regulator